MEYAVAFGERTVGKLELHREGLYYRLRCRCAGLEAGMYRLSASCGGKRMDLGILLPMDDGFGLDTRFPIRRIGEGELSFCLSRGRESTEGRRFVPIRPEEPFPYLSQLKQAYLEVRGDTLGASFPIDL